MYVDWEGTLLGVLTNYGENIRVVEGVCALWGNDWGMKLILWTVNKVTNQTGRIRKACCFHALVETYQVAGTVQSSGNTLSMWQAS